MFLVIMKSFIYKPIHPDPEFQWPCAVSVALQDTCGSILASELHLPWKSVLPRIGNNLVSPVSYWTTEYRTLLQFVQSKACIK